MIRSKQVLWVLAFGLVVPFVAFANQTPQSTIPPAAHHRHAAKSHAAPKINLNTATKEEIVSLPGMTDELADKVIAARPYKSRGELVQKNILTKDEFKKISSMVMTGNMKAASTKK